MMLHLVARHAALICWLIAVVAAAIIVSALTGRWA